MNKSSVSLHGQRGVSLSGLIVVLALIMVVAVFAMKVFPTYSEYTSARDAIMAAKEKSPTGNISEMKGAFAAAANVNSIESINSSDLKFEKVDGKTEVYFDYDKVIPLFKNVTLVIRYAATTAPNGEVPERADPADAN